MGDNITEQDILNAFQIAGLNPGDITETESFKSVFRDNLTKAMTEATKEAQDKKEAEIAAPTDAQFRASIAGKSDHEKAIKVMERRKMLDEMRQTAAPTDAQLQQAIMSAITKTTDQMKQDRKQAHHDALQAEYDAEMRKLAAESFTQIHIDRMVELKRKYRAKGLEVY